MKKHLLKIFAFALLLIAASNCTNKFDITEVGDGEDDFGNLNDTLFIQQNPVWEGFNKPQDMIIGREPFIYVADTENDRIVMLDEAGQVLGELPVKHPVAIAQDYKFNLLVAAKFDTTINSTPLTYSAVYKIDMVSANHQIGNAKVKRILPKTVFDFNRPDREYTGIAVFYDNSYYVARTGPRNSNPIDPDNAILRFRQIKKTSGEVVDTLLGRVPLLAPEGTGVLSINGASSITSFDRRNYDIILTLTGDNSFKVQWLEYVQTADFTGYQSKLQPFASDMLDVSKFERPEDSAIDDAGNIYVADAEKDSIYKFNNFGDQLQAFGGDDTFDKPYAVAFFNRTLYVLDTYNDRILRYILSTEID